MSSNNNDNAGIGMAIAVVAALAYVLVIFAFMVAMFAAFVLTVVCLFAWNSPVTVGRWTLEPDEARGFVYRGLAGAVLLPLFLVFLAVFFGVRINSDYTVHAMFIGYTLGSIGVEILIAQNADHAAPPHRTIIPPDRQIAPPESSAPPRVPFRFASWDDEDGK